MSATMKQPDELHGSIIIIVVLVIIVWAGLIYLGVQGK